MAIQMFDGSSLNVGEINKNSLSKVSQSFSPLYGQRHYGKNYIKEVGHEPKSF